MLLHTVFSYFLARRYSMKKMDIAYMMMGAGAVLAYQKYKKPMMKKMNQMKDKIMNKTDDMLENMM